MRIGIVNDSLMAREALRRAVVSAPEHQIAWLACDGGEAIQKAVADTPDVILMDLIMPGIDGVEATRQIMRQAACPILVVTATVSGHLGRVYEAMGLGALDAVDTPSLGPTDSMAGATLLLAKIATIGKLVGRGPRLPAGTAPVALAVDAVPVDRRPVSWHLVIIGASTGGPAAVATVLRDMPDSRDASTVIIQHVDAAFAPGLTRWLADQTGRRVDVAESGERPLPGRVYLAATNDHLVLDGARQFRYVAEPIGAHFRPSVDVFMASAGKCWPEPGAAALLTGMLRDGAVGLLGLRQAGWLTVAQDEATSVVYGMPRAAAEIGAAQLILPIQDIGAALADRFRDRGYRIPGGHRR